MLRFAGEISRLRNLRTRYTGEDWLKLSWSIGLEKPGKGLPRLRNELNTTTRN